MPPARFPLAAPLVGGVLGAAFCLAVFGPEMVRPTNLGWTMRHDTQTYVLAFHHFRREPWRWPPGAIAGVGHPVGTSIGNTDAIPLVALPLKLLHLALPDPLQYFGAWLLLCYVLQGVLGVLLVRQVTADRTLQVLGGALFVQTPALLHRFGHTALCAHWTLLAAIWIAGDRLHDRRWRLGAWLVLCAAVAAIQPYLAAMVVPMALAGVVSDGWAEAGTGRRVLIGGAGALVAVTLVVFWLSGYFLLGSATNFGLGGVGDFSMNLLSPVIGTGYSGLLPAIPTARAGQYEGMVYFGAGWLALALAALAIGARRGPVLPPLRLGWIVVGVLWLLAIGPVVTAGGVVLVDLSRWTPALLAVFRSSGRFGWLAMYVVFAATLATLVSRLPRRAAVAVVAAGVALQALDLGGAYGRVLARAQDPGWANWADPLQSAVWDAALPHYRHLVMAPPDMCAAVWPKPAAGDHLPFSLLAGRHGATVNSGFASRYDAGAVFGYCAALQADLATGRVHDDSLYVLSAGMRQVLGASTSTPLACGVADGYELCATERSVRRWREAAAAAGVLMTPVPAVQP